MKITTPVAALPALPVLLVGVRTVRARTTWWTPDLLQTLLAVRSAEHLQQLAGPWSRIGIAHPGPAWFYAAAPSLALAGGHPSGLVLGAATVAAGSLAAMMERQAAPGELADLSARLITAEGEIETLDAGIYRASELLASGLAHEAAKELLDLLQRQIERHEQREAS